jgi:putative glutamine amidotransferase
MIMKPGLYLFLFILILTGCKPEKPVIICISKASPRYINWLKRADSTVTVVDLYQVPVDSALRILKASDGLLLSGGEDVYPGRYNAEYDTSRCTEMNLHRDSLEFALIHEALKLKMPLFGICRGEQILNVALGGSLIVDIPVDTKSSVSHQCSDYVHCFHMVSVQKGSQLFHITSCDSALVATNHHQAARKLAPGLFCNAWSKDGLMEGIEWKDPSGKSFLIGVQWHPERMEASNPLSGKLAGEFVSQVKIFHIEK